MQQICLCSFRVRRENNFYHTVLPQVLSLIFFHLFKNIIDTVTSIAVHKFLYTRTEKDDLFQGR